MKSPVWICLLFCLLVMETGWAQSTSEPAAKPTPLVQAHAHNDYYHTRPFWDAYDHGFCSIEVDIYKYDDSLLVAHNPLELLQNRKLTDLYLEPLKRVVKKNGGRVYPDGPPTIQLLIDIKQQGDEVFALLKTTLEPLSRHYLLR